MGVEDAVFRIIHEKGSLQLRENGRQIHLGSLLTRFRKDPTSGVFDSVGLGVVVNVPF